MLNLAEPAKWARREFSEAEYKATRRVIGHLLPAALEEVESKIKAHKWFLKVTDHKRGPGRPHKATNSLAFEFLRCCGEACPGEVVARELWNLKPKPPESDSVERTYRRHEEMGNLKYGVLATLEEVAKSDATIHGPVQTRPHPL
ncbi:MAG: hypothetical protein ACREHV_12170 [Rhizomicrobium sp.]